MAFFLFFLVGSELIALNRFDAFAGPILRPCV